MKLTPEPFRGLVKAVADAHYEACLHGDCTCVTEEEHRRMLASRPLSVEKETGEDLKKDRL